MTEPDELVDWERTARRMRASAVILLAITIVVWLVAGVVGDGPSAASFAGWLGLALGVMFLIEVVVVGGAALRGMLRAGERGERLASPDVGLFPSRRPRRRAEEDR